MCFLLPQGENAEAILNLQRGSGVARSTETVTTRPVPMFISELPLPEQHDSHAGDNVPSNNGPLPFFNANAHDQSLGSKNTPRRSLGPSAGTVDQRESPSPSRSRHRTDSAMTRSRGQDEGTTSGSEGGVLDVGSDSRKSDTIERHGGRDINTPLEIGHTFCGWQSPLRHKEGSGGSGSVDGIGVVSRGDVTKGPTPVGSIRGENNHARDGEEKENTPPTKRRFDGRNDSDSDVGVGGGSGSDDGGAAITSSIYNLFTAVQLEVDDRRGKSHHDSGSITPPRPKKQDSSLGRNCATEDFNVHAEPGPSAVDLASTMTPQGCPAMAVAGIQAHGNHFDVPSVKLSFAARGSFPFSSAAQHPDTDADVAFRRHLHSRDAGFAGKNFGDSILGEVNEGPSAAVGSHDWSVRVGCDSYGGVGADAAAARSGRKYPGSAGSSSATFDGSVFHAAMCGKDDPNAPGHGSCGVLSPNLLPATPSPLSLDRRAYHPMQCWMGL